MIKKKLLSPLAVIMAGSILFLSGCEVDLTTINEDDVPISVEIEQEGLTEGTITVHSIWYDSTGRKLANANISIYDGETMVYSGKTDSDGNLNTCPMPCNTELVVTVTNNSGEVLADSDLVVKLSDDYGTLSVYPTENEDLEEGTRSLCTIEAPSDRTNIRAAAFVTEGGAVSFANLTPYVEE